LARGLSMLQHQMEIIRRSLNKHAENELYILACAGDLAYYEREGLRGIYNAPRKLDSTMRWNLVRGRWAT
jgi:hypothetical protein